MSSSHLLGEKTEVYLKMLNYSFKQGQQSVKDAKHQTVKK